MVKLPEDHDPKRGTTNDPTEGSTENVEDVIDSALSFSSFSTAEDLTGASSRTDKSTAAFGALLNIPTNHAKEKLLKSVDDTTRFNTLDDYLRITQELGFEVVYAKPFKGTLIDTEEMNYVLWRDDGILLHFDTYGGDDVRKGSFYFNWRANTHRCEGGLVEVSGCPSQEDTSIWVGSMDCREALRHKIGKLEKHGQILPQWASRPSLWLLSHGDTKTKDYDHKAITEAIIAELPEKVREAITPMTPTPEDLIARLGLEAHPREEQVKYYLGEIDLVESQELRINTALKNRLNPAEASWDQIENEARARTKKNLGLSEDASLKDIVTARRKLIGKMIEVLLKTGDYSELRQFDQGRSRERNEEAHQARSLISDIIEKVTGKRPHSKSKVDYSDPALVQALKEYADQTK